MSDESRIYEKLMEISGDLGEMKSLQASANERFDTHLAADVRFVDDTNTRLSTLEAAHSKQMGVIAAVGVIATFIGAVLGIIATWFSGRSH
jgi:hypothetical protein